MESQRRTAIERTQRVGLDSQCFTYLVDTIASASEPTDSLAGLRRALHRIWLYAPIDLYVSETVVMEYGRIRHVGRRDLHDRIASVLMNEPSITNLPAVQARTTTLLALHTKKADCRILAEAEDLELDVLLTYDFDFRRLLGARASAVSILTPQEYWESLAIPRGARLVKVPHSSNPLAGNEWWQW